MRFSDWLRPGIKVKRWILLAILGILIIVFAVSEMLWNGYYSVYYKCFYAFLNITGIFLLYIAITEGIRSIIALINKGYLRFSLDSKKIENLMYEKRLLIKGPKIVVIGGGT